jgi:2-dehydro-3-deoxygalactonokinase
MKDYIAVDWGSTQLRGWLIRNGQCVGTKQLPLGITRLNGRSPADVFAEHVAPGAARNAAGADGRDDRQRCGLASGAVSGLPAAIDAPGQQRCAVAEGVWIIPGLKIAQDGEFNVMRGEETQLLGAMELAPAECYVLPGTHCKWVQVTDGMVRHFATAMTGELHHLLMTQSLIGKGLPAQQPDEAAFERGLEKGLAQPSLISELFVASRPGAGRLAATSVSDYLSGLLIGAEVATLGQRYRTSGVTLVGDPALNARYSRAMRRAE